MEIGALMESVRSFFVRSFFFLVLYILLGLLQLWFLAGYCLVYEKDLSWPAICYDGVLLFFSSGLYVSAVALLENKKLLRGQLAIALAVLVGLANIVAMLVCYAPVALVTVGVVVELPSEGRVFSYTLISVAMSVLWAYSVFMRKSAASVSSV